MANVNKKKGVIGILTGGGDVPGLNPAIRAVTFRAIREGCQVIGLAPAPHRLERARDAEDVVREGQPNGGAPEVESEVPHGGI